MRKTKVILVVATLVIALFGFTNPDHSSEYPGDYTLFKIDRSRDPDVVMYDVNLDSKGKLNGSMPISVYWDKNTTNGGKESLTGIQKKFGYGIRFQDISEYGADFQFVSYFKRTFELRRTGDENYHVYTVSNGEKIEVKRMYIHFENDSFWFPAISRIELYGIETNMGNPVKETITP